MTVDWKSLAAKGLDVVVGVASAAVGVTGGPEAAKGVQMAGGGIKGIVEEASGGGAGTEKPTRQERLDRQDFQSRDKGSVSKIDAQVQPLNSDEKSARLSLLQLGYTDAEVEEILVIRPRKLAATKVAVQTPRIAEPEATPAAAQSGFDARAIVGAIGKILKGDTPTEVASQLGSMDGALPANVAKRTT